VLEVVIADKIANDKGAKYGRRPHLTHQDEQDRQHNGNAKTDRRPQRS
jgi:hypothetical protein